MNWAVTYYRWWDLGGLARVWCIVPDRQEADRLAQTLRVAGLVNVRVATTSLSVEAAPQVDLSRDHLSPALNDVF